MLVDVERAIEAMLTADEHHLQRHERMRDVRLRCQLHGKSHHHKSGALIRAAVQEVTGLCHVLVVGDERFGVYRGWYEVL